MNCENYSILIEDLIEGDLNVRDSAAIDAHLLACSSCAEHYKTAQREKEIYATYLSDIAPPTDLWAKFEAKINSEAATVAPAEIVLPVDWKTKLFGFFRIYPAFGLAVFLILLGFAWFKFEPNKIEYAINNDLNQTPRFSESYQSPTENLASSQNTIDKNAASLPPTKIKSVAQIPTQKTTNRTTDTTANVRRANVNSKIVRAAALKNPATKIELNERQMQLMALEKAAAQQIEKTELLLRSFRNARISDDSSIDELEYEKGQARKLLAVNAQLRRTTESVGDLTTLELLDRVEPFLLDIANLEKSPQPEKISDIKERVKNQNIIAGLQIY